MIKPAHPVTLEHSTETLHQLIDRNKKEKQAPAVLTHEDYSDAVNLLINLEEMACGGSRVAAQVLLSTYNGNNWQMNLTDLCMLSGEYYRAAIIVIRARAELGKEPHIMIANGQRIFDRLEQDWQSYHVKNRYRSRK